MRRGRIVSLDELTATRPGRHVPSRPVVAYCRISINTLAKAQPRIEGLGAQMVAIVPNREQFAAEMRQESNVNFPILSDMDNGYAMSLNLAIWVG